MNSPFSATSLPADARWQLALETTGRGGSIALLCHTEVRFRENLVRDRRTAASIGPAIQAALRECRALGGTLAFLSVADGPGSFTGLRIGVTAAKTLGYALGLPLIGVDSLAAIAATAMSDHANCHAVLVGTDAYRGQTYTGRFERTALLPPLDALPDDWSTHPEGVEVADAEVWRARLAARPDDTALAGDAKPFGALAAQCLERSCDAVGVGLLAIRAAIAGQFCDPMQLVPRYLKLSAAEENLR